MFTTTQRCSRHSTDSLLCRIITSKRPRQLRVKDLPFVYSCILYACMNVHGGSMKSKPNCLCHIYLMPDRIIPKLSRYLENSIKNMIPTHGNILFNK